MILIGLVIGIVLFVVLALLCITIPEMSSIDWLLIVICAVIGAVCGYGASKSKVPKKK